MKKIFFFQLVAVILIIACQPKTTSHSTEADKAAIRKFNDKCLSIVRDLNKENAEAFVKFTYSEDAVIFPPNAKSLMGQAAIIGMYKTYPPMSEFNQEIQEIEVFDDFAYMRLNWSIPVKQPKLEPYIDSGIIFIMMRKLKDGNWKVWREIWNSDISTPIAPKPKG
jgi:ketosteroid isomerase-like protein